MKKLIIRKGSSTSGNHGHVGRPGLVGGSAVASSTMPNTEITKLERKAEYTPGRDGWNKNDWLLSPDGDVYQCLSGHSDSAREILNWLDETPSPISGNDDKELIDNHDFIRIEFGLLTANFETKNIDTATLRRLQRLVDADKIDLSSVKRLGWAGHTSKFDIINKSVYADMGEFMSAKYVVEKPEDEEHHSTIQLKQQLTGHVIKKFKESHDTVMVGFDLSGTELGKQSEIADPHVTLVMVGKMDEINKDLLLSQTEGFAAEHAPLTIKLSGFAVFPASEDNDNKAPVVALVDSVNLPAFRQALYHALITNFDDTHGFTAHMTIGYTDKSEVSFPTKQPEFTVIMDKLTVFYGDEHYHYPLSGNVIEKQFTGHVITKAVEDIVITIDTDENDDWMKALPGYETEHILHEQLRRQHGG